MGRTIDYYMTPASPWAYLGHDRFVSLCRQHDATVRLKPVDLSKIFPNSGGLPLPKRAPQRQAYRLVELARWSEFLNLQFNAQPKFVASGPELASRFVLAASEVDVANGLAFAGAVLRARWAEERDIADPGTLAALAEGLGLDVAALASRAAAPEIAARFDACTQEAIEAQVFGVPWYLVDGEPFWGQDRLDLLARKLAK